MTSDIDSPKLIIETLCVAQSRIGAHPADEDRKHEHIDRLQRLINAQEHQMSLDDECPTQYYGPNAYFAYLDGGKRIRTTRDRAYAMLRDGTAGRIEEAPEIDAPIPRISHANCNVPGWEYATTEGQRKNWDDVDTPPSGDGWERNTELGRNGWERFDYTEESYWRRPKPITNGVLHSISLERDGMGHIQPLTADDFEGLFNEPGQLVKKGDLIGMTTPPVRVTDQDPAVRVLEDRARECIKEAAELREFRDAHQEKADQASANLQRVLAEQLRCEEAIKHLRTESHR